MNLYQAMQLGAERLKPMIKNEENKNTKQKYLAALILKNILSVLFCISVVAVFSSYFGSENSMVGVVAILLILTFRFTNLDFKINQSAFTLIGVFLIYAICPYLVNWISSLTDILIWGLNS